MRQTKSFTVLRDEHEVKYDCTQLGAWEGSKALIRAQKIAAAGVNGLDALIQAMTESDLEYFSKLFAKCTFVTFVNDKDQTVKKNLAEVFDVFYSGEYFEMTEWLVFSLGMNFGNYFFLVQTTGEKIKIQFLAGAGKLAATDTDTPTTASPSE